MKCIPVGTNDNIFDLVKDNYRLRMATFTKPIQWILVDECQFLTEAQIDQLSDVVDFMDVEVICYGLRTDFKSKLFPASKRLFELADGIEEIKSSCDCGTKASINARFNSDGKIITEGSQILVGGDDLYHAVCRKCWKKIIMEK
jgi:thymidine kinase